MISKTDYTWEIAAPRERDDPRDATTSQSWKPARFLALRKWAAPYLQLQRKSFPMNSIHPPRLFISYSHRDSQYLKEFTAHLSPLVNGGALTSWSDLELVVGDELDEKLRLELESADLVAFLVSSDFLNSISCYQDEVIRVLDLRQSKTVEVLPIILRNCLWEDTPLGRFLAVPKDGTPISTYRDRDSAWLDVVQQIKRRAEVWRASQEPPHASGELRHSRRFQLDANFKGWLASTEVAFHHKLKDRLLLSDVFVYPDLARTQGRQQGQVKIVSSSKLLDLDFVRDGLLLHGEGQSGKTALLKMLYQHHHERGVLPLYVDGKDIAYSDTQRALGKSLARQYFSTNWDAYVSSPLPRLLLVDNYHELKLNSRYEERFLASLNEVFQHVVLVAEASLLFDERRMVGLSALRRWEIMPFGHARRGELVERWNSLGQEETIEIPALHLRNDETTRNLNAVIRKNVLPPKPIFVLTVLQLFDSTMPTNFELSSYGHCYQTLILQALHKVGVKAHQFDLYVNYLSEFAYSCLSEGGESLSESQFQRFKERYSEQYLIESHDEILDTLRQAEILGKDEDTYRFSYRYIFYFYAGKYLSDHFADCGGEVEELCGIHSERNANVVIFLIHHSRNREVIDQILSQADTIFGGASAAKLDREETDHILELIQQIPALVIDHIDVESQRKKALEAQDDLDAHEDEGRSLEEGVDDYDGPANDIIRSARMIEVLGQVLRNRSGSLPKRELADLARCGYGTGLRFLSFWLDFTKRERSGLVAWIAGMLLREDSSPQDAEELRGKAGKAYLSLCYDVSREVLRRIANSLGAKELLEIFELLEGEEPESVAVKLVNIAIRMEFTKTIPKRQIGALNAKLYANPIAGMLLKELVVQHLYLNEVEFGDKQWISSKLGIPMRSQRMLEGIKAAKA